MFSTDFIFRQQENFVDNKKCQARFKKLCNKILLYNRKSFVCNFANVWGGGFNCPPAPLVPLVLNKVTSVINKGRGTPISYNSISL